MPSYGGVNIFGPCPIFTHDDPPNHEQINKYPGVRGVERLNLGLGVMTTQVEGILCGVNHADLGLALINIRQLKINGAMDVLYDSDGVGWPDAVLHSFRTTGPKVWAPGWGWTRQYEMTFLHTGYIP